MKLFLKRRIVWKHEKIKWLKWNGQLILDYEPKSNNLAQQMKNERVPPHPDITNTTWLMTKLDPLDCQRWRYDEILLDDNYSWDQLKNKKQTSITQWSWHNKDLQKLLQCFFTRQPNNIVFLYICQDRALHLKLIGFGKGCYYLLVDKSIVCNSLWSMSLWQCIYARCRERDSFMSISISYR